MSKFNYFPIIKTTDGELKGYSSLDEDTQKSIMPIFELTKSRRSRKNPTGKVQNKIEKLKKIIKNRAFILDLTTEASYANKEIEKMTRDNNEGYKSWRDFVLKLKNTEKLNLFPVIHYHPFHKQDVKKQINNLKDEFQFLAFRIEAFHTGTLKFIQNFKNLLSKEEEQRLILILDGGFISTMDGEKKAQQFLSVLENIKDIIQPKCLVCPCSGFPKSVTEKGYGQDSTGKFPITEVKVYKMIDENCNHTEVYYGDYASIHPKRYDMAGGYWIPRIDFPLEDKVFYYRYRRNGSSDQSYIKAAKKIIEDTRYAYIKSWGNDEIIQASQGVLNGKSPSHWIAVRMNIHITRQQAKHKLSIDL